jgi:3-deoxy-D-manno-octulosonic-acid transferase
VAEHDLPAILRAYRLLTIVAGPLAPLLLSYRLKRGKEHAERLRERLAISGLARPAGPLIWMHGASVGELNAVFPLIERIRARDFNLLITTGTVSSAELAERRLPPDVIHQFVPLDTPRVVRRFLDHWQPDLGLFVESDLWPNLIVASADRNIPLILLNGRLSRALVPAMAARARRDLGFAASV